MGLTDKISGRFKETVGDVTGNKDTKKKGQQEEQKGEAKEQLATAQEKADAKADEVSNLERKTN